MLAIGLAAVKYLGDSAAVRRGAMEFLGFHGGVVFLAQLAWLTSTGLVTIFWTGRRRGG
jgi:hypothetical protein